MWYYSAFSTGTSEWSRGEAEWDWNVQEGQDPREDRVGKSV